MTSPIDDKARLCARDLCLAQRLAPLDLSWSGGQLVALLGPNGSGKSTLLASLAGLLPARGQVLLEEEEIATLSLEALAARRAMLPQRQPHLFHTPVFAVLALGLGGRDPGSPAARAAMATLCQALELDALLARDFSRLSGGEQQRVLIARTLLQVWPGLNPAGRLLLLDEPLAGLDLHHQLALLRLLKSVSRQGLLVVMAIHDINLAIDWADRMLCLQGGKLVCEGGVDSIDEALLERVFQIKTTRIEAGGRTWFMPSL
ncbi:ATP-binding cassette domain-containing protein [Aeromonas bivalvium]|uniref:ATP-binding cassette domain-containing protein n=1 Tax=Aeromonas bivalvium TaxID=440079 RepID=UPI003D2259DD